jgi:hypothetical protein
MASSNVLFSVMVMLAVSCGGNTQTDAGSDAPTEDVGQLPDVMRPPLHDCQAMSQSECSTKLDCAWLTPGCNINGHVAGCYHVKQPQTGGFTDACQVDADCPVGQHCEVFQYKLMTSCPSVRLCLENKD